jgi:hypothetical protein
MFINLWHLIQITELEQWPQLFEQLLGNLKNFSHGQNILTQI